MYHGQSDFILAIQATPIALGALRDEMLRQYEPPLASKAMKEKFAQVFRELASLGVQSTAGLDPDLVARFVLSKPTRAPGTVRGLLMHLRVICNYAEGRRYLAISPFRLRKLSRYVKVHRPTGKRHLSAEEVRRLLELLHRDADAKRGWAGFRAKRLYAATALVAYTALRRNEALCLWVEDLDLGARVINLVPRGPQLPKEGQTPPRLKTEESARPIALPSALIPIIEAWLPHRLDHPVGFRMPPAERIPWLFPSNARRSAWSKGSASNSPLARLKAAAKRAGIEHISWQMLRRTWATRAEAIGIHQALITRQARHTDQETTKRYYQELELDALKDAVEGFDF